MASPCIVTYKGVDYPYDEFEALLHDGLLGKMIADGTIKPSALKGAMPDAMKAFIPVETPRPASISSISTPSGRDLSGEVEKLSPLEFTTKYSDEFDSANEAMEYYKDVKDQIFDNQVTKLKEEIGLELKELAQTMSVNPIGSTKLWGKMARLMGLFFKKGVTTVGDFAKAAGYKVTGALKDLWDAVTFKGKTKATDVIRGAKLRTLNSRLYYSAALKGLTPNLTAQDALDYIKEQIAVLNTLAIHSKVEDSTDIKAATEAMKALYQDLSGDLDKVNARIAEEKASTKPIFELGEKLNYVERALKFLQDSSIWQKKVQSEIEKLKGILPDNMNPYLKRDIAIGKVQQKIDKLYQKIFGKEYGKLATNEKGSMSLLERMKGDRLSQGDLDLFLYAQHAKERNARVAMMGYNKRREAKEPLYDEWRDLANRASSLTQQEQIRLQEINDQFDQIDADNPIITDGSGMTDQEADSILGEFQRAGKSDKLDAYAKEFRDTVIKPSIEAYRDSGMMTDEEAELLLNGESPSTGVKFDYYIPLKVNDGVIADAKGSYESKSGSSKPKKIKGTDKYDYLKRDSPFARALMDAKAAIQAAEDNNTKRSLYELVKENPNSRVWEVVSAQYQPDANERINETTSDEIKNNSVVVMVDGKKKYIHLKHPGLREAWEKNGGKISEAWQTVFNVFRTFNNIKRSILTTWNPVFASKNLIRDVQDAVFNATGMQNPGIAKILKNIPKTSAYLMKAGFGNLDPNSEMGQLLDEYLEAGGKISWMNYDAIDNQIKEIDRLSRRYNKQGVQKIPVKLVRGIISSVEAFNESIEIATRLSVYKAMRESGMTAEKAAGISKNLTVNFNRKGTGTPVINALYLFSNAGIQSTYTSLSTVAKSNKAKAAAAGLVLAGFLMPMIQQAMLDMLGEDDEEKEKFNKLVSEEESEGQYILPMGGGRILRIPKPYGAPRMFFNIGEIIGDATMDKDYSAAMWSVLSTIGGTIDPIAGSSPNKASGFTPTLLKPATELAMNKDWHNAPIYPTQAFGPPKPDFMTKFKSINPMFDAFTQDLYKKTDGGVDISPETIDYFLGSFSGGIIKEVTNGAGQLNAMVKGEAVDPNRIPLYGSFLNDMTTQKWRYYKGFYDIFNESGKKILTDKEQEDLVYYLKGMELDKVSMNKKLRSVKKAQKELKAGLKPILEDND